MTLLQLKQSNGGFPQGGFPYQDPRTGFKCNGWEGTPQMHAVKIIQHRRANPKFYPPAEGQWFDTSAVVQEIYQQKALTHPHLFRGYPDKSPATVSNQRSTPMISPTLICSCGSNEFTAVKCLTCGGSRIKSWKCTKCGREVGK